MLMLAMKTVTITLLPVQKIVHALATVQMDVHVVMMKLTVQTDHSWIISSTQKMMIGIISLGAKIILHQTSLQMQTVNNSGPKKLLNAQKPVITRMTIAKLVATMIHFAWTIAQKQDNVASMIAHVKNTAFLVVLV